jgi:hypothetical protein
VVRESGERTLAVLGEMFIVGRNEDVTDMTVFTDFSSKIPLC